MKVLAFGSTTIRRAEALKGAEPDACFYVQSAGMIGNKIHIDFATDPPPDIVVEVDISHESTSKLTIYADLAVPEVWRFDGRVLTIYRLEQSEYVISTESAALPALTSETLTEFLNRAEKEGQYETVLAFEEWLRSQTA
ncbi:MAG TPA: Uma2 family endonuclease [Blastocatellia bacterium]|nr:Uma2 family endonuclease [Blastocatellia bacterium]